MMPDTKGNWFPLAVLVAALVIWTTLLALGAYFEWGADVPRHDVRKPLLMLGTLGVFLFFWGLALWLRSRRPSGKQQHPPHRSHDMPEDR